MRIQARRMLPHRRDLALEPQAAVPERTTRALRDAWAPARTRHHGATDRGLHRPHNEDAFLVDEEFGLFLVCDGVGGRASGEVASAEAATSIGMHLRGELSTIPQLDPEGAPQVLVVAQLGAAIRAAMEHASRVIHELARTHVHLNGMGTTASVVAVTHGCAVVGHVGDSRVYHARGATVRQLTVDHTLANLRLPNDLADRQPAAGRKSAITRALGLRASVEVDIITTPLLPGDRLLLCTDGLSDHLDFDITRRLLDMDLELAAPAAISYANQCGGRDNITALFVEVEA